jgi:hypothetical protein
MGQVFSESLVRDTDVDLLRNIEISINVKVELSLFGEMEVYVTGDDQYCHDIEDNEKGDLGLQSKGSFLDPPTDKGSDPLDGKGEVFEEKHPVHTSLLKFRGEGSPLQPFSAQ